MLGVGKDTVRRDIGANAPSGDQNASDDGDWWDVAAVAKERQGARSDLTSAATAAEVKRTTDEVAKTVGLGSGDTYERSKAAIKAAEQELDGEELLEQINAGTMDMSDLRKELRQRKKRRRVADIAEKSNQPIAPGWKQYHAMEALTK